MDGPDFWIWQNNKTSNNIKGTNTGLYLFKKKKKFSSMLGTELCSLKIHLLKSQLPVAQNVTLFGDELFKGMKLKDAFRPPFEYGVLIEYD